MGGCPLRIALASLRVHRTKEKKKRREARRARRVATTVGERRFAQPTGTMKENFQIPCVIPTGYDTQSLRSAETSSFRRSIGASGRKRMMSGELLYTGRTAKWNKRMQGKPKREVNRCCEFRGRTNALVGRGLRD